MSKLFFSILFSFGLLPRLFCADYSIVFVHIGTPLPTYLEFSMAQAVLFNPKADIYLIANQSTVGQFQYMNSEKSVRFIASESLIKTLLHQTFHQTSRIDSSYKNGLLLSAAERFFYLHDFISQYNLTNVFHLENDMMLYADLGALLPVFQEHYQGIGATFHNDSLCIPGFVYIAKPSVMQQLCACMLGYASRGYPDTLMLAMFKNQHDKESIDYLPTISDQYVEFTQLRSKEGHVAADPRRFQNHFDYFDSIFDGAALGQYLGGIDPFLGPSEPGYINPSSIFDPALFTFEWISDEKNRKVPYATIHGKKCRINNLHIHSKKLEDFCSK